MFSCFVLFNIPVIIYNYHLFHSIPLYQLYLLTHTISESQRETFSLWSLFCISFLAYPSHMTFMLLAIFIIFYVFLSALFFRKIEILHRFFKTYCDICHYNYICYPQFSFHLILQVLLPDPTSILSI